MKFYSFRYAGQTAVALQCQESMAEPTGCTLNFAAADPELIDRLEAILAATVPTIHRSTGISGLAEIFSNCIRKACHEKETHPQAEAHKAQAAPSTPGCPAHGTQAASNPAGLTG